MSAAQLIPVKARVLSSLRRTPGMSYTAQELADALHPRAAEQTVRDALTALSRRGDVRRDVTGTGRPARFWVSV